MKISAEKYDIPKGHIETIICNNYNDDSPDDECIFCQKKYKITIEVKHG